MNEDNKEDKNNELVPTEPLHDIAVSVARIDAAPTLAEKEPPALGDAVGRTASDPRRTARAGGGGAD